MDDRQNLPEPQPLNTEPRKKSLEIYRMKFALPQVNYHGVHHVLPPMVEGDGTVWNELNEELALQKSDFKGQSAADKVITVCKAVKTDYHPKYPELSWEKTLGTVVEVKKELRGAV